MLKNFLLETGPASKPSQVAQGLTCLMEKDPLLCSAGFSYMRLLPLDLLVHTSKKNLPPSSSHPGVSVDAVGLLLVAASCIIARSVGVAVLAVE